MKTIKPAIRRGSALSPWKYPLWLLPTFVLAAGMPAAASAQEYLPPLGGPGGGQFKAACGGGLVLVGVELKVADDVDAVRPICAVALAPNHVNDQPTIAAWNGGPGGIRVERLLCPYDKPVVLAISIGAEGERTLIVNNVHLFCGLAATTDQTLEAYPSAIFDGPGYKPAPGFLGFGTTASNNRYTSERCPGGEVAVGIHGRSGVWLDAMGLICDAPEMLTGQGLGVRPPGKPPVALGRPKAGRGTMPPPALTICDAAIEARRHDSPAAPELERQCRAENNPRPVSSSDDKPNAGRLSSVRRSK